MGKIFEQRPVKLITSIIYKDEDLLKDVEARLCKAYGPIDGEQLTLPFDKTDYYYPEMGKPLDRRIICFRNLIEKEDIAEVKLFSNRLEDRFKSGGKRTVNIDPGYITEAKLVLLTTKDYTHRVYVGKKIFAESTLFFQDGTFRSWPWTYPDYGSEEMIIYFNKVRELYMEQIKS